MGDRDHAGTDGVHLEDPSDDGRLIRVDHALDEGALAHVGVPIALAAGDVALLSALLQRVPRPLAGAPALEARGEAVENRMDRSTRQQG